MFWDTTPYIQVELQEKNNQQAAWGDIPPTVCFFMIFCLTYSSTLNMEAVHSSETPVNLYQTILVYIPEGSTQSPQWKTQIQQIYLKKN
jgi:hypothetical protein